MIGVDPEIITAIAHIGSWFLPDQNIQAEAKNREISLPPLNPILVWVIIPVLKISILPVRICLTIGLRSTCIDGFIYGWWCKSWNLAASVSKCILHQLFCIQQVNPFRYFGCTQIRIKANP